MDSIGETRWLILTPGSVSTVHFRGSCRSATRRTFFAALWTDFKKSGLTCDLADRISSREIQTPARVRSRSSSFLLQARSEEHTSELQSHSDLVCRLLLEKKNTARWATRTNPPAAAIPGRS